MFKGKNVFSLLFAIALAMCLAACSGTTGFGSGTSTQGTSTPPQTSMQSYLCQHITDGGTVGEDVWSHFNCGISATIVEIVIVHRQNMPQANLIKNGKYAPLSLKGNTPIHQGRGGTVWEWTLPGGGALVVFIHSGIISGGIKAAWTLSGHGREIISFEQFGGPKVLVFQNGVYQPGVTS